MKAIVQEEYGEPEAVLRLQDMAKPVVGDGDVLVRVHAASIHIGDWILVRGVPYIARMAVGLRKPRNRVPGTDIAGTVETVGKDVTRLRPGDEVFGWCTGAFAEYACAAQNHFVQKPANLTFEQAAAVGVSASAALQLLRDQGKVRPGQKVLINGASGGLGTFAVQIAKSYGAHVTAVCSTGNLGMVRSIGADHVIDYTREDFVQGQERYDFILDNVGNHSLSGTRGVLTSTGKLQSNNGTSGGRWFGTMGTVIKTALLSMAARRQSGPSIKFQNRADLVVLKWSFAFVGNRVDLSSMLVLNSLCRSRERRRDNVEQSCGLRAGAAVGEIPRLPQLLSERGEGVTEGRPTLRLVPRASRQPGAVSLCRHVP